MLPQRRMAEAFGYNVGTRRALADHGGSPARILMKSLTYCLLALASLGAGTAWADDVGSVAPASSPFTEAPSAAVPEGSNWFTSAELGAISTSGNTTGTSVTGKIDARHEMANWSNEYIFSGYFKEDDIANADGTRTRTRSAERYSASAKAAFKLLEDGNRAFLLGSHVNDKFGAYTRYTSVGVGYGTQLLRREDRTVDVEIGPGYFHGENSAGEIDSGMTVRGAAQLRWRVSPSAAFSQTVSVERGTQNTHSIAETALSTKINGTMQMKAAFSARSDSNVPETKKNTDTQTSLTLVYSF
jgi:putative salt-induced outer membrane protein YdiY